MNVLWIMCDQLRWDYLSCAGHKTLQTPHIDALAARGVRFDRAYVQSPFCGPSRMSSYTGRYCRSHGATWNGFPLRVGELTLGDHLRKIGVRPALVGKTHMMPDREGMEWLGIDPEGPIGVTIAECGFEPWERDEGLHPYGPYNTNPDYSCYLRDQGFEGEKPWEDWANSGEDDAGNLLNGWLLKHSDKAARIPEEHSETPYMTNRAMDFMEQAGDQPWLCHLSFIKPHWPYVVPEPYASMYGTDDVPKAIRTEAERENAYPVFKAYMESKICKTVSQEKVRTAIIPAYMGLIKQIDDHMGRLFAWMEEKGLMEDTMIVFTSDHGDYLGDHWMGEKDLFHDQSVRVPLIVYDPRPEADKTSGTVSEALVEGKDLAPTFVDFFDGSKLPHILEGRDLTPLRHGFAYTGDIGTLDAEGFLTIRDRKKNVIFDSGFNILPREDEEILLTHSAVSSSCVVACAHERSGEVPVAFVTLRSEADTDSVLAFCTDNLIAYKLPAEVIILPQMPLTPAGKVDRTTVQASLSAQA